MIWLIGAGAMAQAYNKVLQDLQLPTIVIGRSLSGCHQFQQQTGTSAIAGGLSSFLQQQPAVASFAIVAVSVMDLFGTCQMLLGYGVRYILLEKPGALYQWQLEQLETLANAANAAVLIAYNRRFYASVNHARQLIQQDGGVTSFHFEMTEWSHLIVASKHPLAVKARWLIANTAHVIDLAFYLGGEPSKLQSYQQGALDWHPAAAVMTGSGLGRSGALFSYHGNWQSAGRWSLELSTTERKLQLMPLEQLQQQVRGSVVWQPVTLEHSMDTEFKAGLYAQVKAFAAKDFGQFCTLAAQRQRFSWYEQMAGYSNSMQEGHVICAT